MRILVIAASILFMLAGCGQKGPLRVAEPPAEQTPAPETDADAEERPAR